MRMTKKKVLVIALAVSLAAIISMGTLAWFNASESITNEFLFDDTDNDGTPDFEVEIFEHDENGLESEGVEYLNAAIPGAKLDKDPTVRNSGDYNMYTRIIVTLSHASQWQTIYNKHFATATSTQDEWKTILETKLVESEIGAGVFSVGVNGSKWIRYASDAPVFDSVEDTLTYVYYYDGVLAPGTDTETLFDRVSIPGELEVDDMEFITSTAGVVCFTISVRADAIQADNMDITGANNAAYNAFNNIGWEYDETYENRN